MSFTIINKNRIKFSKCYIIKIFLNLIDIMEIYDKVYA